MRIDGPNPLLGPALLAALSAKEESFGADRHLAEAKAASPPPAVPPIIPTAGTLIPQPATSVAMLVTLAAINEPAERRRRAIVHAERGLATLERLRDELAAGVASPDRLRELADWTKGFTLPDDPALAELARDIEVRVRVELAKHDLTA